MRTECHLDYETILCGQAETVHLAMVFQAEKQPSARKGPIAFSLVIDNSGSMAGLPLQHAKAAAGMVLKHLRADDRFALVTFSDSARTVIPLQEPADKARLLEAISGIRDEGSTNLTAGWMLGRDELSKTSADLPRKLLLLTDGHLNAGITEPGRVRQIVGSGLERERIRTACLGFGEGYNEDLLDELAKAAAGSLHNATTPEKFPAIFQQELESLMALSAQNLRVRLHKLHYCTGIGLLSDYPVVPLPEGGVEIAIGDLVSEEQRVLVLALEVLPIPLAGGAPAASLEGEALLEVEIAYDQITEAGILSKTEQRTIRVAAVQSAAEVRVNEKVVEWVAAQEAGRTIAEAILERDRGDTQAVLRRIRSIKEKLARYNCAGLTREALANLDAFEQLIADWNPRNRKASRQFSHRTRKMSTYYAAEELSAETDSPKMPPPGSQPPASGTRGAEEPPSGPA